MHENVDYTGIATLVAACTSSVISLMGAVQAWRNEQRVKRVEGIVDGKLDKVIGIAEKSGIIQRGK